MKKLTFILILLITTTINATAQTEPVTIYNPLADAEAELAAAVKQAQAENKHVLVQVGGNWCPWCVRLHDFMATDAQIDSLVQADYVRVLVNYSKENKNDDVMQLLQNPQRFGFPVLVVLNQEGTRLHTQDSWFLEQEKSYDKEKLMHFLKMWNVEAAGK